MEGERRERIQMGVILALILAVCALSTGLIVLSGQLPDATKAEAAQLAREEAFERRVLARIDNATLNLQQVLSMWKDDPKNYNKTAEAIDAIREWIKVHP